MKRLIMGTSTYNQTMSYGLREMIDSLIIQCFDAYSDEYSDEDLIEIILEHVDTVIQDFIDTEDWMDLLSNREYVAYVEDKQHFLDVCKEYVEHKLHDQ